MSRSSPSTAVEGEGVSPPLLRVRDLSVQYRSAGKAPVSALDGASFDLEAGAVLGVLGESGGGKSSLALAIPGLLPPAGRIAGGSVHFRGERLDVLAEPQLEKVRGEAIGFVFQDPSLSLHPLRKVGAQIAEVLAAHRPWKRRRCRERAAALLSDVGLGSDGLYGAYPHQLSGGQRQRVVIAQAVACEPELVIADEATAALDVGSEARILELLRDLQQRLGVAVLYISHDPDVLAAIADRLLVLYAGRVVEEGPADRVLEEPLHPYTEALLQCRPPRTLPDGGGRRLPVIPGEAPVPGDTHVGCRFAPRCDRRLAICDEQDPPMLRPRPERKAWCFAYDDDDTTHDSRPET